MGQTRMELIAISAGRLRHLIDTMQTTPRKTAPADLLASACCEALLELARALAEYTENSLALHRETYAQLRDLRTELDATKVRVGHTETPALPRPAVAWDQGTCETGSAVDSTLR